MIPAARAPWFLERFASHVRGRIQDRFSRVVVSGLAEAARLSREEPLVVVSNHTAWWDPLVALHVCHTLFGIEAFALMDSKNLRTVPFFQRIGAFGVDLDDKADGARAIRYGAKLLDRPGRVVWVFPQGRERPLYERPLGFREGAAQIARVARVRTLPVAIHYAFGAVEAPELHVAFGAPLPITRNVADGAVESERAVVALLDRIECARAGDPSAAFETLWQAPTARDLASKALGYFLPLTYRA